MDCYGCLFDVSDDGKKTEMCRSVCVLCVNFCVLCVNVCVMCVNVCVLCVNVCVFNTCAFAGNVYWCICCYCLLNLADSLPPTVTWFCPNCVLTIRALLWSDKQLWECMSGKYGNVCGKYGNVCVGNMVNVCAKYGYVCGEYGNVCVGNMGMCVGNMEMCLGNMGMYVWEIWECVWEIWECVCGK